jgi:hypothetical protein
VFGLVAGGRPDHSGLSRLHDFIERGIGGRRAIEDEYLHGFVGFSEDDKLDPSAPWKHPLQRYM